MTEERFWLLASLKFSGEATPAELEELESWLKDHPELRFRLSHLEGSWTAPQVQPDRREAAFNKHMQRLSNHLSGAVLQHETAEHIEEAAVAVMPRRRPILRRIIWGTAVAASLVTAWLLLAPILEHSSQVERQAQNTVSTKRGSKSKIQLPDGTQVWLNADSKITYNENFQGKLREVQLTGEAFFDVVRDEQRPFIIHTNYIDVKVLGTAFNVRSYADEQNTETSLMRGSVEITLRNHPEKKFTLKPNDKLIVNNEQAKAAGATTGAAKTSSKEIVLTWGKINFQSKTDTVATEALWTRNKLAFDKESLEEIALKIERWYDVKVTILDDDIRKTEYSMTIDDESLQQVMEALRVAGKFRYSINKKEVLIRS